MSQKVQKYLKSNYVLLRVDFTIHLTYKIQIKITEWSGEFVHTLRKYIITEEIM